jgi:hypothetical protein
VSDATSASAVPDTVAPSKVDDPATGSTAENTSGVQDQSVPVHSVSLDVNFDLDDMIRTYTWALKFKMQDLSQFQKNCHFSFSFSQNLTSVS